MSTHAPSTPDPQLILFDDPDPERRRCKQERDALMATKKAQNTEISYGYAWKSFTAWCLAERHKPLPASFDALSLYLTHLINDEFDDGKLRLSTVRVRMSAIAHYHLLAGLGDPIDQHIRGMLKNARRERKETRRKKRPVTPEQVLAVLAANGGDTPKAIRDRAIFSLLFATGWRRDELRSLNMGSAVIGSNGVTLSIGASKADQEGEGREVSVPYDEEVSVCPVRLLAAWMKTRGEAAGPLFCPTTKHGEIRVSGRLGGRAICCIVQEMLTRAGVKNAKKLYGAHSLRSGMITASHLAGAHEKAIMHSTGHRSILSMWAYIDPLSGFTNYPMRGVMSKASAKAKARKAIA